MVAAVAVASSGCGSSGGNNGSPQVVANAGYDQTVFKGDLVTLDGRASRGPADATLVYAWRQVAGPSVALSDDRTAQPSFVAPRATTVLCFTLQVGQGTPSSARDEVIVAVQNRAPYADAGADQVTATGTVVTLDTGTSSDPDGDPLTASWFQRSGVPVALVAHTDGSVSFVAPATPAVLDFSLFVSDGEVSSAESAVRVAVLDESANWPPMANAGVDRVVPRRAAVVLSGSGVDRESDPLTFSWTQMAGPAVSLVGADGPTLSFVAPAEEADLEFRLVVADALATGSDRVLVSVRNQAPVISALSLAPAAPVTTDALVASVTASDPDQDPVSLTWAWLRDGAALTGQDGPTLDPALSAKGDVVAVRVTASDGLVQTTAEATVTIQDSRPELVVSAPETAIWGQPVTFTATVSDPDGDPVGPVVLRHGPAGMTLSGTGEGAWTPALPMFDRSLRVEFAVGLAGSATPWLKRAISVEDPARAYPLRGTGIEIPVQQDGVVAVDVDGDGRQELLVASRTGVFELGYTGTGYAQRWSYPFAVGPLTLTSIEARDVNGDGRPETFFATRDSYGSVPWAVVVKLDGASRREVARTQLDCADLEAADLDQDGAAELVCLARVESSSLQRVIVLDAATLAVVWTGADLALGTSLAVGNVDADPALEIVTPGAYVFDGVTYANEWAYSGSFGVAVDTGDLDGDGVEEIVGMESWSRLRRFSGTLKAPIWEKAVSENNALLVADVDGDGAPEIAVGGGQWVTAYRYVPATNDLTVVFQIGSQDHGVSSLAVGDLDGDGGLEIAWGAGASSTGADVFVVAGRGRNGQIGVEWKTADPSQLDGPFLGAKPARTVAGGARMLLFEVPSTNSGYSGARLVRLDPATGGVAISPEIGSNWSNSGALDAADVDGDGVEEALVATASFYDGYFVSWDFAAGAADWTSPAGSGNARAITHADVNGDGVLDLMRRIQRARGRATQHLPT